MSALGMLVGLRLLTEIAAPDVFGGAILALGGVTLIHNLLFLPLAQAALRHFGDPANLGNLEGVQKTYVSCARRRVVVAGAAVMLGAVGISMALNWSLYLGPVLALLLVFETLRGVVVNLLNGARRQRAYGSFLALDGWLRPLGAFSGALMIPESIISILGGQMIGIAVAAGVFIPTLGRNAREALWKDRRLDGEQVTIEQSLKKYAAPLVPAALATWISGLADRYILSALAGVAAAGVYSAGYGLVSRPFLLLGATIEATLRQPLYEAVTRKDFDTERKLLRFWSLAAGAGGAAGFVVIALYSEQIAGLFLGKAYVASADVMPWVAAGYLLFGLSQVYERICYAHGATKAVLQIQIIAGAASVLFATVGVWIAGYIGAAVAVPVYFGLQLMVARCLAVNAITSMKEYENTTSCRK